MPLTAEAKNIHHLDQCIILLGNVGSWHPKHCCRPSTPSWPQLSLTTRAHPLQDNAPPCFTETALEQLEKHNHEPSSPDPNMIKHPISLIHRGSAPQPTDPKASAASVLVPDSTGPHRGPCSRPAAGEGTLTISARWF